MHWQDMDLAVPSPAPRHRTATHVCHMLVFHHVTGPCEAAPQPAGLSVTLHPHQRQTLFRLLAREHDPLGFNGLLWSSFKNSDQQWWMSLILGKLSLQAPPPTVTGGFLGELLLETKFVEV